MPADQTVSLASLAGCSPPRLLLLLTSVLSACSPTIELYYDICDGLDTDQDGTVDEGRGETIGCAQREVCVAGMCQFECGDGECSADADGAETCGSCPADCGACPFCGDGSCTAGTGEDCTTCSDDCGACPSCGDGACNGRESCLSCQSDCGRCPGECATCGDGGACPTGFECVASACTGTIGCVRVDGSSSCTTLGGATCGRVPAYGPCTDGSQCGAPLTCEGGHCTFTETGPIGSTCGVADCPYPPSAPPGLLVYAPCQPNPSRDIERYTCTMHCGDGGLCPYGMTCVDALCI